MSAASRLSAMLASEGIPHAERNGRLFVRDRRRILPFGPVLRDHSLTSAEADDLLRTLGGWWVQWTRPADGAAASTEWFAVVCRRFVDVEQIPSSNVRSKLRRGLKRCRVTRVPIDEFQAHAFDIHDAAVRGYSAADAMRTSREAFTAAIERERGFDDLRHYWLVRIDDRPVAYAKVILHGTEEADYTALKFDPEQLKHYPSYALIHEMNRHYLGEAGFACANDGQRSILHDTHFQEFLVKDLQFERFPLRLEVRYARWFGLGMTVARMLRTPLSRRSGGARALLELDRCAARR